MAKTTFVAYGNDPCMPFITTKQLAEVFCRSFTRSDTEAVEWMINRELMHDHRYILGRVDERLAGFVSWRRWGEDRHRLAELFHIGVDLANPEASGLGRQLIGAMEEDVHAYFRLHGQPGGRKVFILTHADNYRAHNLYRRCGYQHQATLPSFFHPRIDAVHTGDEYYFARDFPGQATPGP